MREPQRDRLDELLDEALTSYEKTAAREGLEKRILARIREQPAKSTRLTGRLVMSACAAVAVCVLLWWGAGIRTANKEEGVAVVPTQPLQKLQSELLPRRELTVAFRRPRRRREVMKQLQEPKLAQFPTPSPLTAEERALLRLAARDAKDIPPELKHFGEPIEPIQMTAIQIKPLD